MHPQRWAFAFGLFLGVAAASAFWWQKAERDVDGAMGKATEAVSAELTNTRSNLTACRERLRAAGLPWE